LNQSISVDDMDTRMTDMDRAELRRLDEQLRAAMTTALRQGHAGLAVALDTARDFLETVLEEEHPAPSRLAVARARVDIALAVWRRICGHDATEPIVSAG
jgi:hypothetical protein